VGIKMGFGVMSNPYYRVNGGNTFPLKLKYFSNESMNMNFVDEKKTVEVFRSCHFPK
jgi:hypothetical protein